MPGTHDAVIVHALAPLPVGAGDASDEDVGRGSSQATSTAASPFGGAALSTGDYAGIAAGTAAILALLIFVGYVAMRTFPWRDQAAMTHTAPAASQFINARGGTGGAPSRNVSTRLNAALRDGIASRTQLRGANLRLFGAGNAVHSRDTAGSTRANPLLAFKRGSKRTQETPSIVGKEAFSQVGSHRKAHLQVYRGARPELPAQPHAHTPRPPPQRRTHVGVQASTRIMRRPLLGVGGGGRGAVRVALSPSNRLIREAAGAAGCAGRAVAASPLLFAAGAGATVRLPSRESSRQTGVLYGSTPTGAVQAEAPARLHQGVPSSRRT